MIDWKEIVLKSSNTGKPAFATNRKFIWSSINFFCCTVLDDFIFEEVKCLSFNQTVAQQIRVQVILFEIDCAFIYANLHDLFCQFISWTNLVNSGKSMDNCWTSCQVMTNMENFYVDLRIINLYNGNEHKFSWLTQGKLAYSNRMVIAKFSHF